MKEDSSDFKRFIGIYKDLFGFIKNCEIYRALWKTVRDL